ncbi:MAG TPA: glutamine--tRNA ligase/YqeY domain fusion protein [Longimicrobiales bacterium]|nr:glutamine--tRNA ligase/YqeY domain fusion protein [Longimicrobiales bacterium]
MSPESTTSEPPASEGAAPSGRAAGVDFIRAIVAEDLRAGTHGGRVVTRFPPEPNGYLHIGHAKSICLNFGIAEEVPAGRCHLRFDDTNPETEDVAYVESIIQDVRWLGFDWGDDLYFASDYFEKMYGFAQHLIREGKAYVDSSTEEEIRELRGTVTEPGRPSRYRDRSVEENLDLFRRMRAGEFPDGAHVLRAKIDLASPNMLLRDPILYRIRHASHYRQGDEWCIYPLYDYAHPLEDAIEDVTHSLCTLEFEINRPLYDWVVENAPVSTHPRQYEFARLNLDYTVMSKRKLLQLVLNDLVSGWDDPRLPTIAGLRRRGVTPEAIRAFCDMIGVAKTESRVDIGKLEYAIRDDLNQRAPRVLCVLRPLRVELTDVPEGEVRWLDAPYFPHDVPREGARALPFSRNLLIERTDFMEEPPKGYFRLAPGRAVRLRHGPVIRCDEVVRDDAGDVVLLRCSRIAEEEAGKVKGTIHWVSEPHALPCTVRLYDRLFTVPDPEATDADFKEFLNPDSLVVIEDARVEPSIQHDPLGSRYQFERLGYFYLDPAGSDEGGLVFNRTVTLRDTWAKGAAGAGGAGAEARPAAAGAPAAPRAAGAGGGAERGAAAGGAGAGAGAAPAAGRREAPAGGRREAPARPAEPTRAGRGAEAAPRAAAVARPRSPELEIRFRDYTEDLGLSAEEADLLTRERATADLFDAARAVGASAKGIANWVIHELPRAGEGRAPSELGFAGPELGDLVALVEAGTLSSTAAREILAEMAAGGGHPAQIMERRGLRQISDPEVLWPIVEATIGESPSKVDEYRAGRFGLLGFFVGQVMRKTDGKANPEVVKSLLRNRLG